MYIPTFPFSPSVKNLINISEKGCNKWARLIVKNNNQSIVKRENLWEDALGNPQGIMFWDRCYRNVKRIFFDNYLKLFYYYIIRGTLKTNRIVSKFKPDVRNSCDYCNSRPETIVHLFWQCDIVKLFIDEISVWMSQHGGYEAFTFNLKTFIFGLKEEGIYGRRNLLSLYKKHFIWKQKFGRKTLDLECFLKWLAFEWKMNNNAFKNDPRLLHSLVTVDRINLFYEGR